jgi:preprotein translocase subunit SecA
VDIKLGGEIAEEVLSAVHRVLRKAGHKSPSDMSLEERREAVRALDPSDFGIYESEVAHFLRYFEDMESVKALGGLHVIGSERHEARRIDNQLRGRAARQGDPGSSRFYLSLQDDLMRLFGGAQVSGMMERLKVDDSLPLEVRLVGNIIESSQHRVEGANFDVRKHLLEYDDVLNKQRAQIYAQRDRIFTKQDLGDDIAEMLEAEVRRRVDLGLADEEGPWRLIAWLEQMQPPLEVNGRLFPTYGLSLILKEVGRQAVARQGLLDVMQRAVEAEAEHQVSAVQALIERAGEALDSQIKDRADSLDAYLEGIRSSDERQTPQRIVEELNSLLHLQLRPNAETLRRLADSPEEARNSLRTAVTEQLTALAAARLIGSIQNRIGEQLQFPSPLHPEWSKLEDIVGEAARAAMERRRERLLGQIENDLEVVLQREPATDDSGRLRVLLGLSQGARTSYDQRTHRQVRQVFARFTYIFLAARLLEGREAEEVIEDILTHLEAAQESLRMAFGQSEYMRLNQNAGRLADFGPAAQMAFGQERLNDSAAALGESDREALVEAIGKYVLNELHRQLLLGGVTELWVDYLTKVEALRVSVGLEAYAQRDPLVQYKGRASEMFQQLLEDVRGLVIGRAFAARPRRLEITPVEVAEAAEPAEAAEAPAAESGGRKRRRRRH